MFPALQFCDHVSALVSSSVNRQVAEVKVKGVWAEVRVKGTVGTGEGEGYSGRGEGDGHSGQRKKYYPI